MVIDELTKLVNSGGKELRSSTKRDSGSGRSVSIGSSSKKNSAVSLSQPGPKSRIRLSLVSIKGCP